MQLIPAMLSAVIILLACICSVQNVTGYRILGVFPHSGKSHFDMFEVLMKELARRGHQVTVISHFPLKQPMVNYSDVSLVGSAPILLNIIDANMLQQGPFGHLFGTLGLAYFGKLTCEAGFALPSVQGFLKQNHKFDLIIQEHFNTDCWLALNHKFKVPHMAVSSSTIMCWINDRFGNLDNPSFIPMNFMGVSDKMSFFERVKNTFNLYLIKLVYWVVIDIPSNRIAKQYFGDDLPPLSEIAKNTSLMLVNTHFTLNRPRPYVPAVIEVGGIHLSEPKKLPPELEKYINDANHGVIYFSMGSMVKAVTFPDEKRKAFLDAFAELPQKVLWKWENESLSGQPKNVMIKQWMPQYDILNHPNVVAFITHGGLLGTTEGIHTGVPMVTIPMFGDQYTNAAAAQESGAAVVIDYKTLSKESILMALKKVLDPRFREGVKRISNAYRDRQNSPMDTAIYWVEYVARHKGAPQLKVASADMPYYQYLLLDVYAFMAVVVLALSVISYYSTRSVFRLCISKSSKYNKLKKN